MSALPLIATDQGAIRKGRFVPLAAADSPRYSPRPLTKCDREVGGRYIGSNPPPQNQLLACQAR